MANDKATIWTVLADIGRGILRGFATTLGLMFGAAAVGAVIGGLGAVGYGFPLGTGLIVGAVAELALALLVLVFLHADG